ncbi:serine phosphatase RsbU (regulator of sigma subunit) [Streptomyces sp. 2132.2]|uniref:SpoIIE family protein phosphatase n=1 Tax=Streptomyces sp. 2132.2 TaxID=2485161 RepID=UPI000F49396E|nr:SpoIIE family protein phosphatase [Streptomyces sp. 2132.2]ROQ99470.1 serine phosphatase RsbU (regulator of sigma subunit) [Streptomyces sp. 2132.2]
MAERGASPEVDWPAQPDMSLALNRMGTFDWDLDSGQMHLDPTALEVLDLRPEEFTGTPAGLRARVPPGEEARLDARVAQALKDGRSHYGAYVRTRLRDGTPVWTHIQGHVLREANGRPYRIIGILRDAAHDPGERGAGGEQDEGRRRMTGVVERTSAILAHARTVNDVTDVLKDPEALGHLGAVSVMLGIVDGGRIHLVAEGQLGSYVPEIEYTRIDARFPMSEAVRNLQPVFVGSREEFQERYPQLWPYIEPLSVRSGVYLPLIAQGRAIAALGLLYQRDGDFTAEERNLLVALGSGIAQSLQRAILFEQEHDLAEGLQRAMLPRRIPEVPGARIAVRYRAARMGRDIGGDWYDVVQLGEGRVGVMIGDVEGHDTDAAAVMGQLRIVLRAYVSEGHTPGTAMARASAFLRELETDRFATCTYAEVDLNTGMLQLVRAGHLDPVVRRGDGSCHRIPVAGGLPLGLPPREGTGSGSGYPVTSLELHPGDTLVLCTDGLLERPDGAPGAGMQELMEAVHVGPVDVEELADVLCDLVGDAGAGDDMALLLLRRRGTPAPRGGGPLRLPLTPGDPDGPAMARHLIRAAVAAWGAADRADEIELAADELMTNALVHTDGGGHLNVRLTPEGRIRIEVEDTSSALPRRREAGDWAVSGRGLLLVDQLAEAWGVEPRGGGKSVWCEFAVPGEAAAP